MVEATGAILGPGVPHASMLNIPQIAVMWRERVLLEGEHPF